MTQQQLDEWNAQYPPGSPCWVRYDDGSEHTHYTMSFAWRDETLGMRVAVDGLGAYSLSKVFMAQPSTPSGLLCVIDGFDRTARTLTVKLLDGEAPTVTIGAEARITLRREACNTSV